MRQRRWFIHYAIDSGEIARCSEYFTDTEPMQFHVDGSLGQGVALIPDPPPPEPVQGYGLIDDMIGKATAATHWVAAGVLVEYTPQQRASKLAEPRSLCRWDNTLMQWADARTLSQVKRDKLDEMKAAALAASEQDITVQSVTFAADAATRAELAQELALAQAEGAGYSCDWQRADGSAITLTGTQVKGLLRQISTRLASIRATFRSLRAQVAAATTSAEVELVVW